MPPEFSAFRMDCHYKCQGCGAVGTVDRPGPTQCGRCGGLYLKWENAVEVLKSARKFTQCD